MREMAGDSHHHMPSIDKKMHSQHQHSHRRNPSSSSSSSSSSTSSSSSSSTSSSSDSSPHRSGYKKESKRKSRPSKRMPSTSDRSKMKKAKSSSSLRKHSSSSSKPGKKSHPSKKDHDKVRSHSHSHSHKSSHSPTRRKTFSKKLLSPGRKRTPSPSPSSRKTHKLSPGRSKRSKSRKRSGSPRDRLEYRTERLGLAERSLSHGREANLAAHSSSSSRSRDPRVEERVRRVSPEQLSRDRYSRYEKERLEEYVEPRRERRSPVASRPREVERKDSHRHRDYERHEREHYEERRREDARREEREREQLREREVREREILRDRELMKERERVEMLEREQERERERERLREVEERRSRYGREHEFVREREVVLRSSSRDFEEEREFYASRVRPELDTRVMPVDDRRAYEDTAYDRFQSERERARYESSRSRYEELALHDRRALPPPLDDRCADRRAPPIDTRFSDERRRSASSLDPRVHDAWMEEQRELERLERSDHYPSHVAPLRHRQHPEWPSRSSASTWERHKHARHDEWADEYARSGASSSRAGEWAEEPHDWVDDRVVAPSSLHQDQWSTHSRRSYRDEWAAREAEWVEHAPPPPYSSGRDLLPSTQSLSLSRERAQQPPVSRRSRRDPVEQSLEPPPSRHHMPPSSEEEGLDTGLVPGRGGDMVSPQPSDQDQSLMAGNDGELWEYDPGKGSWVRRPDDPTTSSVATAAASRMSSERESLLKKEKQAPEPLPEETMDERDRKRGPSEDRKRGPSEDRKRGPSEDRKRGPLEERKRSEEERSIEEPEVKRQRTESPPPAPPAPEEEGAGEGAVAGSAGGSVVAGAGGSAQPPPPAPLQEKDTFSDISDDVDDILNQEVGGFNEDESRNISTTQVEESRNLSRENGPAYEELVDEDEETHLEEISDDELEEDRQAKFNVAGALDINWAVLVRDNKPPTNEVAAGTALKRFKAPHLLARLGVSTRFARPEVVEGIRQACAGQSDADTEKVEVSAVIECGGVARLLKARAEERQRILDGIGPNRKALCARQDIELRRQLCNLPKQDLIGESPLLDRDLFRQSLALLKSC